MRRWPGIALALVVAGGAISCGRVDPGADDQSRIRVGIVFDIGGKDDRSFNAAAWAGVKCAETGRTPNGADCGKPSLGIVLRDVESGSPTAIEPAMRAFAERGFDLIIGIGFAQGPIIETVATDYPGIHFAVVDGVVNRPNVASLVFKEHEGAYLVGIIAARASRTGTVGFLGGMDIGLIHRFARGFEAGVRAVNPRIRVVQNYVGVTDAAWNNPGKGKEIALAQIAKGADVIFAAAGNSGLGAFDAVEQEGMDKGRARRYVIGVDSNQNMVKPGYVLTSMIKRVDNVVYDIVRDVASHRFTGGLHVSGLDSDAVGYAMDDFNRPLIPQSTLDEVEAVRKKIIAGTITVPDAMLQ
jgi:basic membrane protein A